MAATVLGGENQVVVDALPYYDQGYEESGVREAALALVEEETRRYRPTKNYLDHFAPVKYDAFETDVMKTEFERLQARLPMDMLSMKRYELPQPVPGRMNDVAAWQESVDNSLAQLEHQSLRIANLELMSEYGSDSWKLANAVLQEMVDSSQKRLVELKRQIQDINWKRKNEQMETGSKLRQLEESWVGLVSKNYEIEQACMELENEVQELEQKRKKLKTSA